MSSLGFTRALTASARVLVALACAHAGLHLLQALLVVLLRKVHPLQELGVCPLEGFVSS